MFEASGEAVLYTSVRNVSNGLILSVSAHTLPILEYDPHNLSLLYKCDWVVNRLSSCSATFHHSRRPPRYIQLSLCYFTVNLFTGSHQMYGIDIVHEFKYLCIDLSFKYHSH